MPTARVSGLLVQRWEKSVLWAWVSTHLVERKMQDPNLAIDALHVLATNGPPDEASSPMLRAGKRVSLETGAKGVGPAGWMEVPHDPHFDRAGGAAPTRPHSTCPKAAAMVQALVKEGLMERAGPGDQPNAQVFVKHKFETKAALIMNVVAFNHTCSHKARRFKLLSLKGLNAVLHEVGGGGAGPLSWMCRSAIGPSSSHHSCSGPSVLASKAQ